MANASTTTIASILKEDYRGPVKDLLNQSTILLSRLQRVKDGFSGNEIYLPLHKGRNVGTGARAEAAALPTAGYQQWDKALYKAKNIYTTIRITGQAIAAAKSNVGSFLRSLDAELQFGAKDMKSNINRQLWHDGSSILTQCKTTSSSTSVECQSTKFLKDLVGANIDICNGSDGADKGYNRTISSITDSDTFVIDTSTSTDTDDVVILKGSRSTSAWGVALEMWGLEALISNANPSNAITDTIGGITRVGNAWWQSNVLSNSGTVRPLSLDLMQQAFDQSEIEGSSVPGLILTNHACKRRYASLLVADKRYPPGGEITLDGGYKALEFNGVPLVADKDASLTLTPQVLQSMYFLDMAALKLLVLKDFGWLDEDGEVLKFVSGYDMWEAVYGCYMQLAITNPPACTALKDIDESA